jgi:hypothetical protein
MAIFKSIETTGTFASNASGCQSLKPMFGNTCFTLLNYGNVVGVNRRHVITISPVFHLQLPVPVIGIGGAAPKYFDAVGCLVCDQIQKIG